MVEFSNQGLDSTFSHRNLVQCEPWGLALSGSGADGNYCIGCQIPSALDHCIALAR